MYDTICAIATALSPAGIGIIRISGDQSIETVDRLFIGKQARKLTEVPTHTLQYGHIKEPVEQKLIDEVLVSVMRGPNSYTKEDVVEINCHGGILVMEQIMALLLDQGLRLAEPGEFTKRAFLNGRLDLSQAEAVIDLIHAKTSLSTAASVNQLNGQLSRRIDGIKEILLGLIAHIEASIDYPEYDIEELNQTRILETLALAKSQIGHLIDTYDNGKIIRDGIKTAIIGKPNVGKSSLLNALLRENRAIVTDVPGTTRDVLEEYMNIHGIPIKLIDTAGIRYTEDVVEKIGIERSKSTLDEADLVIFMVDRSRPVEEEDLTILSMIDKKEVICLINKVDLDEVMDRRVIEARIPNSQIIEVSTKNLEGIDLLETTIKERFFLGKIDVNNEVYITSVRHKHALTNASEAIKMVEGSIYAGMPEDCYAIDLKQAYEQLGTITGDFVHEDMVNEIFSRFCLGK